MGRAPPDSQPLPGWLSREAPFCVSGAALAYDRIVADGKMQYVGHPDGSATEVMPDLCASGLHRLAEVHVSVGWDGTYRTYTCWPCHDAGEERHTLQYLPPPRRRE